MYNFYPFSRIELVESNEIFDFPRGEWSGLMGRNMVEFERRIRSIDKKETREWEEKKRHREQREAERVQGLRLRS